MTLPRWWAQVTATVFYVGYVRPAPGTWGSLAALPMAYGLAWLHPLVFLAAIPAAFVQGILATRTLTEGQRDHDPSEIVIDEVVGQWIALAPVVLGAWAMGANLTALWPGWLTAFLTFRLFDIWKPGPVGWADARGDATGVMLDDVIAGIFAALVVLAAAAAVHVPMLMQ